MARIPFSPARWGLRISPGSRGDDPRYLKMLATSKHFDVHSGPEPARHAIDVQVSRHDMEDTYLPAFRYTVTAAHAGSVMCAYNSINGEPACANSFLLGDMLRKRLGLSRVCGLGLRRDYGHLHQPQVCEDVGRGYGRSR